MFLDPSQIQILRSVCRLRLFIDDEVVGDLFTSYDDLAANASLPVTSGVHTLRVVKLSDPAKGNAVINDIQIDSGRWVHPSFLEMIPGKHKDLM